MNLTEELQKCQNLIYKGFTTVEESGIDWLNGFCGDFLKFCNKLHKFLVFDCNQKSVVIETCFLCISQVVCCVKYLERTINMEKTEGVVMSSSRQYFLDRILWCFAHLKSTINSAGDDVVLNSLEESNFVTSMDTLVDLIEPYSAFKKEEIANIAQFNAQAVFDSQKIRSTVDLLLSQTLALANVTLDSDKVALTAICQKVLRECMAFQETCSLERDGIRPDIHQRQFTATVFENCLYQLEDLVNESLLRLVFQVLVDCSQHSVESLRRLIDKNAGDELDNIIADFDVNVDRILQIGIFAMALAVDVRAKTTVRSCLASLESLDSTLIPSLYTKDELHSTILEDHYICEIRKFKNAIQDIIDTAAFCKCYEEILYGCIQASQKQFNKNDIVIILEKGKVLDEHFKINASDLFSSNGSDERNSTREYYNKFNLMLNECLAIVACADQVDNARILKRLRIFRSTLTKLIESIDKKGEETIITGTSFEEKPKESPKSESKLSLESFGITPSVTCILYKSRRNKKISDSLKGNTSQLSSPVASGISNIEFRSPAVSKGSTEVFRSPNLRRRVSLRVKMFKRQKSNEAQAVWATYNDQSTNLHITDE
ncbi:serendipity locus protein alpha [Hermetia illucens]|uniref:serendipity locus protein alpha n=1 Tax=Hermetia illucens TaxID=343691 RepID=UPI0018CC5277|nr:serendipity locus protein alpha [Hermetia illucens]